MTDEFVAYWSPWRLGLLTAGAAIFVLLGLWMVGAFGAVPVSGDRSPERTALYGWASIAFFGLCFVVLARRLFNRAEQIRIGRAGIRLARLGDRTILWSEISDVTTWSYKRSKMIVLHVRDADRFRSDYPFAGMVAGMNKALAVGDIQIALNGTDRSPILP